MEANKRVLLGMSGGTDSSVCAMLLKNDGYEVIGVTLRLWSENDDLNNKVLPDYLIKAKKLAADLKITHHVIDAREAFYHDVISYFKKEYLEGRTPNPCAKCNVVLKWKLLNQEALKHQCQYIATGHYVQKMQIDGTHYIQKGLDPLKEQSFFLWGLNQDILSKAMFPLGAYNKTQVREIATKFGFKTVAQSKESIGVCFVQGGKYQPFLKKLLAREGIVIEPGEFIDSNGNVLGSHQGYPYYTVGQRRGLGLSPNTPWYVSKINALSNKITLDKSDALYQNTMLLKGYNFVHPKWANKRLIIRIRYRKQAVYGQLEVLNKNELMVHFETPEWSIAPGQAAAFYHNDLLVGGAYIVY